MGHSRDTVDTRSQKRKQLKHDTSPTNTSHGNHPDNISLVIAIVKQTTTQIKKIAKKATQVVENATKETSRNKIIKNIKDFHRAIMSATTIATNTTDHINHKKQTQLNNKTTRYSPGMRKLNYEYDESYQSLTSRTCSYCDN